jgi:anthranilate synthase/aminodeoxychorismate synthase-like glutamine amidotransferase
MIILIDHFDSFTYNIYQAVAELGQEVEVVRYGTLSAAEIIGLQPEAIILSPGPGHPDALPESIRLIQNVHQDIPVLGICLGHQLIGAAFGGNVVHAPVIRHGKVSEISHVHRGLFSGIAEPLPVMRYHSLVLERETLPECLEIHATAVDDGMIMAVKHKEHPVYGMQFHPESIGTPEGAKLFERFIQSIQKEAASQ